MEIWTLNYTEGIIRRTEFFTTSELAEKLKMNVQVITRKVQAGEIRAYKIGKEWRIPEQSVLEWLEANVNTNGRTAREKTGTALKENTPRTLPTQPSKRKYLLEYILAQFEVNRAYTEEQVSSIIGRYHGDTEAVCREFISEKMMERRNGHFRRRADYKLSD
jgi:excisionase family DNA binding protein